MADDRTKKTGDFTALGDLAPSDERNFQDSLSPDAPPALEGMDDLLSPMSPTSTGASNDSGVDRESALLDPIASLPPIDGDTLAAAAGTAYAADLSPDSALDSPSDGGLEAAPFLEDPEMGPMSAPLESTAVGQAISGALFVSPMESVRNYSDHVAPSANSEVAETPYSLVIEGPIRMHEREALLQILSRENLGIREVELEPQFAAGHILIPRISEYAGVMIVQALRNTTAKMRLGPSERIFVSQQAEDDDRLIMPPTPDSEIFRNEENLDRVETVVLTSAETIPGRKLLQAIDTLHTSMNLKSVSLSQPQSPLFQDAIERLKKQLKFQAHHRGANALVGFKYTLHPLEGHATFKLVVEARAVRIEL